MPAGPAVTTSFGDAKDLGYDLAPVSTAESACDSESPTMACAFGSQHWMYDIDAGGGYGVDSVQACRPLSTQLNNDGISQEEVRTYSILNGGCEHSIESAGRVLYYPCVAAGKSIRYDDNAAGW